MDTFSKSRICGLLLIALFLTSCSPTYYIPNTQNVPLISKRGNKSFNLSGNRYQTNFNCAFGMTNHFSMLASGTVVLVPDREVEVEPGRFIDIGGGSGNFVEFGIGYFKSINSHFVFEAYGLAGFGQMENHNPGTTTNGVQKENKISANIFRLGIQPNLGYKSKYFSLALSSRLVNLSYSNIKGEYIFSEINQIDYLTENSSNFLIEPAFTVRAGIKNIKLQAQYSRSINRTNKEFRQARSLWTFGINVNL